MPQRQITAIDVPVLVEQELAEYAECARCMGMLHLKRFDDHIPRDELAQACSFNSYLFSNKIAFANWDAAREYWAAHYNKLVGRKDVTIGVPCDHEWGYGPRPPLRCNHCGVLK